MTNYDIKVGDTVIMKEKGRRGLLSEGALMKVIKVHSFKTTTPIVIDVVMLDKEYEGRLTTTYSKYVAPVKEDSIYVKAEKIVEDALKEEYGQNWKKYFNFKVDYNERKVTMFSLFGDTIVAKCHPDDIFSPNLGKLICLYRKLGIYSSFHALKLKEILKELEEFNKLRNPSRVKLKDYIEFKENNRKIHIDDVWGKDKPLTTPSSKGMTDAELKKYEEDDPIGFYGLSSLQRQVNEQEKEDKTEILTDTELSERFAQILHSVDSTLQKKAADYGNSFGEQYKEYGRLSGVIRLEDKMRRLKQLIKQDAQVAEESFYDTVFDLVGYGVLFLEELNKEKEGK